MRRAQARLCEFGGVVTPVPSRLCGIMCYVERVGIRESYQNLSVYLAKVKTGSAFAVTVRGRPVAALRPLAKEYEAWQRLVEDGVVVPAARQLSEIEPDGLEVPSRDGSRPNMRVAFCDSSVLVKPLVDEHESVARLRTLSPA